MQNRKLKPTADAPHHTVTEAADVSLAVADSSATSVPSPARGLQANLQRQLEGTAEIASSKPIPFGWTALGLVTFCTAFWAAVVYVLA